jgi:16S rRNA (guanine966-N2)-methyltransferase
MSTALTGGRWRGHPLLTPEGKNTRPTSAKVRQALFNILGHDWTGQTVLDLYAGSGAVGLEALSRGAERVVLVEQASSALQVIRKNVQKLDAATQVQVVSEDACAFARVSSEQFDFVFIDPPFVHAYPVDLMWERLLKVGGVAVFQYPSKDIPMWVEEPQKTYHYGESSLAIYERES